MKSLLGLLSTLAVLAAACSGSGDDARSDARRAAVESIERWASVPADPLIDPAVAAEDVVPDDGDDEAVVAPEPERELTYEERVWRHRIDLAFAPLSVPRPPDRGTSTGSYAGKLIDTHFHMPHLPDTPPSAEAGERDLDGFADSPTATGRSTGRNQSPPSCRWPARTSP